ncbi:MAG: hypothetical protein DRI86_10020 [Bacteroidetes bacterium]|nr:MAG: hypothetical protein DRI86_10020 [Bacteroidota bacterium]
MKKYLHNFSYSLLLVFISLLSFISVQSQNYYFDNYGVKEGLGHSKVKCTIQSADGYIWVGTASGLSRFDGKTFRNYNIDDGIAPFTVNALYEDTTGAIWIGHYSGGLSIYKNNKFEILALDSVSGDITSIVEDENHAIWISTSASGVYRVENPYANEEKIITRIGVKEGLGNTILSISKTKSLGLLFVTRYGVKYFNNSTNKYEFVNDKFHNWPQYFSVITVVEDENMGVWVGTFNGGLYYYSNINAKPKIYDKRDGLANNWISEIFSSRSGAVWVGTFGGGMSYFNDGKIISFNESNGLSDLKINSINEDVEGNIIIGTYSKGLLIFKGFAFINYIKFVSDNSLQVYAISRGVGSDYWIGSNNGLFHIEYNEDKSFNTTGYFKDGIDFLSNDIRFIKKDKFGNQWIGTIGGGVVYFDIGKNKIVYPYRLNMTIAGAANGIANITALEFDRDGHLWVGTLSGLVYYEPENDQVALLTQGNNLQNNDISAIYCDKNGIVWVGHRGKGLTKIDGEKIIPYDIGLDFTPISIFGDEKSLWVGTEGMGLYEIRNSKINQHISINDGLLSNLITAIAADDKGDIFIGTNMGLNIVNPKTNEIQSFQQKDGFIGIEVKPGAMYKDNDGNMWVGTAVGMTNVFPDLLKVNELPPITKITRLRINLEDRPLISNISLNYKDKSILIDYKAICITDANKVEYKVRLLGAESEWQPITKQTYSNFPSLLPGSYTFEVIAKNNSGVWNKEPQRYSFTIEPPFYQTFWFYGFVFIIIVIGVVTFVKVREKQLLQEKAILERKVEERTVEVRQKNSLLAKKNKDITDSINYARRIQRAIMPPKKTMDQLLHSSFIFYKPKDIVSGDFHWNTFHNERLIVTAADCTGHGVPGAFMSMISISSLNKVVKENQIVDPALILDNMRHDIVNDLKQSGEMMTKDGLDIALLSIEPEERIVHFAGAYNPLYVVKAKPFKKEDLTFDFGFTVFSDRMFEVKADRMPIGVSERMHMNFTTKTLQLEKGDVIYISTDGYIDQFGGEKGKKFMSKRFKNVLLELPYNKPEQALKKLDKRFLEWRGVHEQIDDVLVIGICF